MMEIFITNLNEYATCSVKQVSREEKSVTEVGQIGMHTKFPDLCMLAPSPVLVHIRIVTV